MALGHGNELLPSEPYEIWEPLAVRLLGAPPHQQLPRGSYVHCTRLMRTAPHGLWVQLRERLHERGVDPADAVLVHLLQSGADTESGVLVSGGGRVHDFELRCVGTQAGGKRVLVQHWHDITDGWRTTPFSAEIANAFIWQPPPLSTALAA
ncbi:hypothetical protein OV450_2625 [Actinobacteria bacterium OV450]|nr:hypothetical protein OV450_2625 [Actinobacteria bacterium OV450]